MKNEQDLESACILEYKPNGPYLSNEQIREEIQHIIKEENDS